MGEVGEGLPEWEVLEEVLLTLDGWEDQEPGDGVLVGLPLRRLR